MQDKHIQPIVYSIKDAIKISSIGKTRLYQIIASGDLKVTRVGRRTLVSASSLHKLIDPD